MKNRSDLYLQSKFLETCFIEIDKTSLQSDCDVIVGAIYRPPGMEITNFIDCLRPIIEQISSESKLAYLIGDYNINLLNKEFHQPTTQFIDFMFSSSYLPLITKPTRITNSNATLIDNIWTNDLNMATKKYTGIFYADISDHLPIFCFESKLKPRTKNDFLNAE